VSAPDHSAKGRYHFHPGLAHLGSIVFREQRLNLVPSVLINQGFMLRRIVVPFVGNLSDVKPVIEKAVDLIRIPFGTDPLLAFLGGP